MRSSGGCPAFATRTAPVVWSSTAHRHVAISSSWSTRKRFNALDEIGRRDIAARERADDRAQATHHDRGRLTPSGDVTDDEEQPLVGELDDIPEVAPDDEVGARQVARPHPRRGNFGDMAGEQAQLQRLRDLAFAFVQPRVLERVREAPAELDREHVIAGRERGPAEAHRAERLAPRHERELHELERATARGRRWPRAERVGGFRAREIDARRRREAGDHDLQERADAVARASSPRRAGHRARRGVGTARAGDVRSRRARSVRGLARPAARTR